MLNQMEMLDRKVNDETGGTGGIEGGEATGGDATA